MAEEEKQQPEAPKEEKPAKAEKVEKPQAAAKEEKPASAGAEEKGKKISQMTLAEVEAELKVVKEKMGAFQSAHARNLLARRDSLLNP